MANYLNAEKQSRFNQLIALFSNGDISDEHESELIALRKELQKNKADRLGHLANIKAQIVELGVAVEELYRNEEIVSAAQNIGLLPSRTPSQKSAEKKLRPSDSNEVLLILRKDRDQKGPSEWLYRQGRVFERAGGTIVRPWAPKLKQFPVKLLKVGYSADLLCPHFTAAGAAYFATEPGQAELSKLIEVTLEARKVLRVED